MVMSKFCGNCGVQMEDSARICGNCGTPFEEMEKNAAPNTFKVPKESNMTPEKKAKIKKGITLIVILAVVVVVAVIALNIVSNFVGYKGTLRKAVKAVNDYDIETILDVSSEIKYVRAYDDPIEIEEAILDEVSETLDYYESLVGHDPKIRYTIKETYKLSARKLQNFIEEIERNYSYDSFGIEEVVQIDLEIEVTGSNKREEHNTISLYMIKENEKWYVFDGLI